MLRRIGMTVAVAAVVTAAACGSGSEKSATSTPAPPAKITVTQAWARNSPAGGTMGTPGLMTPGSGMTGTPDSMAGTPGMMTPGSGMSGTPGAMMTPGAGATQVRGAAYMKITNSSAAADALIGASSDVSRMTEVHESVMNGDQVTMRPVARVEVPAGGMVELKPGSYHVMFIDLKESLQAGTKFQLELTFEKAGKVPVEVEVRAS